MALDVNKQHNNEATPLFQACYQGHLAIVEYLVHKGADINKANNEGFTPLYKACDRGRLEDI